MTIWLYRSFKPAKLVMSLQARNVTVQDYDGTMLAGRAFAFLISTFSSQILGFWQYGSTSWGTFATVLNTLIRAEDPWAIFDLDEGSADRRGAQQPLDSAIIVPPGDYILLRQGKHSLL